MTAFGMPSNRFKVSGGLRRGDIVPLLWNARARLPVATVLMLALVVLSSRWVSKSRAEEPLTENQIVAGGAGVAIAAAPVVVAQAPANNTSRTAYFGDFHVHSSWSLDSYLIGSNRDGPDVAYRYGRGDPVNRHDGSVVRLRVPLDFMAVTDHDNTLGEIHLCEDANDPAYNTPTCRDIRNSRGREANAAFQRERTYYRTGRRPPEICGEDGIGPQNRCYERARHLWQEIQDNADAFYEPGRFTTFPGYEWTANSLSSGHMHRNVIFEGRAVPEWGGSAVEMQNRPERLWEWLEAVCTGECRVVAIPHNTNLSGGIAFAESGWAPYTPEILALRAWAEPLVEIHQIKGSSECYQGLGTTDEECNFENYFPICKPGLYPGERDFQRKNRCAHASDYVRNALKTGLRLEAVYGVNPFKFGFIASTDDHQSLPGGTDENDFTKRPINFGTAGSRTGDRRAGDQPGGGNIGSPGGLVGVWAEENTRESIFDALRRRETFGTSGTRIRVRFFAGWQYAANLHTSRTLVEEAYQTGVPMGADLPPLPSAGAAPRFVVWATKDAASANLQKVQIVKGWADAGVDTFEQVYDVVCADSLEPDPQTHHCADNGARVDLADCSVSTDTGAEELSTTWSDPDFDSSNRAFYYVRVLENPTCRWTTHRALARQAPISEPAVIKERAWSSPIWYTPVGP